MQQVPNEANQPFDWSKFDHERQSEAATQRVMLLSGMATVSVVLLAIAGYLHLSSSTPPQQIAIALNDKPVIEEPAGQPVELPSPLANIPDFVVPAKPAVPVAVPEPETETEFVARAPTQAETFAPLRSEESAPNEPGKDSYRLKAAAPCVVDLQGKAREATLYFDLSSVVLNMDQLQKTREIGQALGNCPEAALQLWGHADGTGDDNENYLLSGDRARNTLAALSAMGFDTQRIEVVAFGATRPNVKGSYERAYDRRVEFRVIPKPN